MIRPTIREKGTSARRCMRRPLMRRPSVRLRVVNVMGADIAALFPPGTPIAETKEPAALLGIAQPDKQVALRASRWLSALPSCCMKEIQDAMLFYAPASSCCLCAVHWRLNYEIF